MEEVETRLLQYHKVLPVTVAAAPEAGGGDAESNGAGGAQRGRTQRRPAATN
jgi:hypothetical protein